MIDATFKIAADLSIRVRSVQADQNHRHELLPGVLMSMLHTCDAFAESPGQSLCSHCGSEASERDAIKHTQHCPNAPANREQMIHLTPTTARAIASAIMGCAAESK